MNHSLLLILEGASLYGLWFMVYCLYMVYEAGYSSPSFPTRASPSNKKSIFRLPFLVSLLPQVRSGGYVGGGGEE